MSNKTFGSVSGAGAICWWFGRETIKTWFFQRVLEMTPSPAWGAMVEYGPPVTFALISIWLWRTASSQSISFQQGLEFPLVNRGVLLEEAARLAYESAERAGVLDLVTSPSSPPSVRLKHFKYVFMTDDETVLYGAKPPSTQILPIPRSEYGNLYPPDEGSRLDSLVSRGVAYVNVGIRRRDLRRINQEYPEKAREFGRLARR